jgi:hypothetical protein
MRKEYLDAELRRTTNVEEAVFMESIGPRERAMRCYKETAVRAATATCIGRVFHPVGEGQKDATKPIGGLTFTWSLPDGVWEFDGPFYAIALKPTCALEDAEMWIGALFEAEKESGALHHGQKIFHTLGATQHTNDYVAVTKGTKVTWFNLAGQDRLWSAALSDGTKDAPDPIRMTRMIHHEAAHTFEASMSDWIDILAASIAQVNTNLLAQELNPQYLPSRIEKWAELRTRNPQEAEKLDEDLASEFVVETYAHCVIEKKSLSKGLWPTLDALAKTMHERLLAPHAEAQTAHKSLPRPPTRIMYVPDTVTVKEPVADQVVVL